MATKHSLSTPLRRIHLLLAVAILLLQSVVLLFVSAQKQEYHIDELYSYIIANSCEADKISNVDDLWEVWADGREYGALAAVQPGEQFAYHTVYQNTSTDCHPPLYYWILHTLCSFFPNQFSKWFGIALNIVLFVLTGLTVFLLSSELFTTSTMRYLPLILYGFSPFAVDTATFIRMYMLLTFFVALFTYFSIRMLKYGLTRKRMIGAWAVIFLGALTQYYAIVFYFWGVLFFELILLKRQDHRHFLLYGLGALVSIGLMLAIFPYAITQATGSTTNRVGNGIVQNLFNFRLGVQMMISLVRSFIAGISYFPSVSRWLFIAAAILLGYLAVQGAAKQACVPFQAEVFWMLSAAAATFLSISFIGGEYVYLRYLYYITPLIYILVLFALERLLDTHNAARRALSCLLILFAVGNAAFGAAANKSSYLYRETHADDILLSAYDQYPCFLDVGQHRLPEVPTGNLVKLKSFASIYMATSGDLLSSGIISEYLQENCSCVVFVCTDTYWVEGMEPDSFFRQALPQGYTYSFLCTGHLGSFFFVSKA